MLSDLNGRTADQKRESLYRSLSQHGWPDGYDGYMRAVSDGHVPNERRHDLASSLERPDPSLMPIDERRSYGRDPDGAKYSSIEQSDRQGGSLLPT